MDTKALRQKILDLAIHGKLVPQDPGDEPASVLLLRIREEKERLIKEGKIKKGKKSAKTSDTAHYPYLLPNGWVWCRLEDIAYVASGSTPSKDHFVSTGVPYIKMYNLRNQKIDFDFKPQYITEEVHNGKLQRSRTEVGDLIMNIVGPPLGKLALIPPSLPQANFNQAAVLIRPYLYKDIVNLYLKSYLEEMSEIDTITTRGCAGQVNISLSQSQNMRIPLPPLAEQRRIVAEIDHWFSLIDIIESNKASLQTAVKQAKAKILDLAIHGKLVPQDPADEPASELLRRINPKAEITSDNAQYGKVPKGWCLIKGKDLFLPMKSAKPQGDMFKYIDIDAIDNKSNIIKEIKSIEVAKAPSRASRYTQKNDIVFSMVRPYLRNIAMVKENGCIASTGFYICSPYVFMFYEYCYFLMLSDYVVNGLNSFMKGDNSPSINKGNIDEWTFPLPPLSEQHRIVAKIEELFVKLDLIEAEL